MLESQRLIGLENMRSMQAIGTLSESGTVVSRSGGGVLTALGASCTARGCLTAPQTASESVTATCADRGAIVTVHSLCFGGSGAI